MGNKAWTTKERQTVVQMRKNHMSVKKIAEMWGVGENSIRNVLYNERCVLQPKSHFTKEQFEEAHKMHSEGLSYGQIGMKFGLTYDQVSRRFAWERRKNKNGFSKVV